MDYYYYDQLEDGEHAANEDYDYDTMVLRDDESFMDVYERCVKSSNKQVQQYILVLLGCGFMQCGAWQLVRRAFGNTYQYLYHLISVVCGLVSLWFYVGVSSSIFVCLHVLNLCFFLKVMTKLKQKYSGLWVCFYTIICQLLFEFVLKSEQYETIRGPQMVVGMKLISVGFEIQDGKEKYNCFTLFGYLLSPASLILGPWVPLKVYMPDFNVKSNIKPRMIKIILNILFAIVFLNFSNCIIPWLKQLLDVGVWGTTFLDAFSVRCSHYFVCFLSHATLLSAIANPFTHPSSLSLTQPIVNPLVIEFPRSLSDVIRNWNIPMHLWLKDNIFVRLRSTKCPYFVAIFLTYLVSCLVHGFNFKVHLVLMSLSCFSYFENILRRCLAQIFDACIEANACKQNCIYSYCPRKQEQSGRKTLILVSFVNFLFSLIVVIQLAYLGVMLNTSNTNMTSESLLKIWSDMNYIGHVLAIVLFVFYKCI